MAPDEYFISQINSSNFQSTRITKTVRENHGCNWPALKKYFNQILLSVCHWTPCCFGTLRVISIRAIDSCTWKGFFAVYRERLKKLRSIPPFSWTVKIQTTVPLSLVLWFFCKMPSYRLNYFVCNRTRNQGHQVTHTVARNMYGGHICCRF